MRRLNQDSGFTLIEAMIVVALTGVMLVVLTQFFLGGNQVYKSQNAELDVNMSTRSGLDDVDAYVRQANQLLDSHDVHTAGSTVLILELTSVNASSQLVLGAVDRVAYYYSGSDLYRQIYANAASVRQSSIRRIATDITSLAFTYDNATYSAVTSVETAMTSSRAGSKDIRTITVTSKSRLRN